MQQYDIATKVLIESCRDEIIQRFIGIDVKDTVLVEELPQETASLKRSDFPVLVTDDKGITRLVILEIQTVWNRRVPLNLLDYRTRYLLKHDVETISCVILLRPSGSARSCYEDNEVRFKYRLVKIFEMDGREIVSGGPICLLPFVPLMEHGPEVIGDADMLIYESKLSRTKKANMLTSMAILSGLVSDEMPVELISRRKDIMIESVAYDIIKQDGIKEGIQQGIISNAQDMVIEALQERFVVVGEDIIDRIKAIGNRDVLRGLLKSAIRAKDIEEFKEGIERLEN